MRHPFLKAPGRFGVAILCACGLALPLAAGETGSRDTIDPTRIQEELRLQMDLDLAQTVAAASTILAETQDRRVREYCVRWKIRTSDLQQAVLAEKDPRRAYLQYWASATQLRLYFTEGAGKNLFGAQQPRAAEVARRIEAAIVRLGERLFDPEIIAEAKADMEAAAQQAPSGEAIVHAPRGIDPKGSLLKILKLPLLPVSTLQSVANAPKDVENAADKIESRLGELMGLLRRLPEQSRWQLELLLIESETAGPVATLSRDLARCEKTLKEAAESLRLIPSEARAEFEASLETAQKAAPELGKIFADAREGAKELRLALERGEGAAKEARASMQAAAETGARLQETARTFQAAAAEIKAMLAEYQRLREWEDPKGGKRAAPEDYRNAADSVALAAKEVRAAMTELQEMKRQGTGLAGAGLEARTFVDLAFWRAVELAGVVFVLALAFRWLGRKAPAAP